jgi:hypothetical protein
VRRGLGLFRRAPGIGFVPSCAGDWVCSVVRRVRTQESTTSWVRFAEAKGWRLARWLYTEYSDVKDRRRRRSEGPAPLHWDYKLPTIGKSGQVVCFQVKVDCQRQIGAGTNPPDAGLFPGRRASGQSRFDWRMQGRLIESNRARVPEMPLDQRYAHDRPNDSDGPTPSSAYE